MTHTIVSLVLLAAALTNCPLSLAQDSSQGRLVDQTGPVQWIKDDYVSARRLAIKTQRPLFIDFWAPWCHSCLSMKHTVLADPALAPMAKRFVWLSVDTDRPVNVELIKRFPVQVWPTFLVVDAETEDLRSRLLGSATLASFLVFLEAGLRPANQTPIPDKPEVLDPAHALTLADRMATIGHADEARKLFLTAEAGLAPDEVARCDLAHRTVHLEYSQKEWVRCFDKARAQMGVATSCGTMSGVEFVRLGALCASRLGEGANVDAVKTFRIRATQAVAGLCEQAANRLAPDDRSECLKLQRTLADQLGDQDVARSLAIRQRALLDRACAEAKSPEEVMTFNWPRVEVYTYLGIPGELIKDLEENVRALPDEYDPPYRLAWILLKSKRPQEALAPAKRALALVYGPRKGRVLGLVADIYLALGDHAEARQHYAAAHALYASMSGARWTKLAERYQKKVKALSQ